MLFIAIEIATMTSCSKKETGTSVVYFPEVKKIIQQNCISCHYQGGQGMPVILTEDSNIVNYAAAIKAATCDPPSPQNKHMPPDSELSDSDKATIIDWIENGGTALD